MLIELFLEHIQRLLPVWSLPQYSYPFDSYNQCILCWDAKIQFMWLHKYSVNKYGQGQLIWYIHMLVQAKNIISPAGLYTPDLDVGVLAIQLDRLHSRHIMMVSRLDSPTSGTPKSVQKQWEMHQRWNSNQMWGSQLVQLAV